MSENLIFDLDDSYGFVDLDAKEEEFIELQQTLLARCKSANIDVELKDDIISVGFPNGREKRWVPFNTIKALKDILDM